MIPEALRVRLLPALLVLLLGGFAFMPVCDLSFDCGCTWPGAGSMAHCDILTAGPPDCPWCAYPWSGYGTMALSTGAAFVAIARTRRHWAVSTLVGLTVFFATAMLAGVVTSLWLGRPPLAGL